MQLQVVVREQVKLKMGINAPGGAGKTMSALLLALGFVGGDASKVAIIDSENRSAAFYSHLGKFKHLPLEPPFSPERFIQAIQCVEADPTIEICIIDSNSQEWAGTGGCLQINELVAAAQFQGNTWSAWSVTKARHQKYVDYMLQSHLHIITCNRNKVETVKEGKKIIKLGTKEIQQEDFEYELSVNFNIDRDTHLASPSKDRTEMFENADPFVISQATGAMLRKWCDTGEKTVIKGRGEREADWLELVAACTTLEDLRVIRDNSEADHTPALIDAIATKATAFINTAPIPAVAEVQLMQPAVTTPVSLAANPAGLAAAYQNTAAPVITAPPAALNTGVVKKAADCTEEDYIASLRRPGMSLKTLEILKETWNPDVWTDRVVEIANAIATKLKGEVTPPAQVADNNEM